MGTVRNTQGSHRAMPQEGLSPRTAKSGFPHRITSLCSLRGGEGDSTAELTTHNIGIGHGPVGGTECSPSSRNIHLHSPRTLRGAISHEPDFRVCWWEKTDFSNISVFLPELGRQGGEVLIHVSPEQTT